MKELYDMKLHEESSICSNTTVTRVAGGWIYNFFDLVQDEMSSGAWSENYTRTVVFVPLNNEFM